MDARAKRARPVPSREMRSISREAS